MPQSTPQVIVVTGTSRGIGRAIVQLLAQQQLSQPLVIYATSRSGASSEITVSLPNEVQYRRLDTTDHSSIDSLLDSVLEEHGTVDVLINNAAVSYDHCETPELARKTVENNYYGTRDMCLAFLDATKKAGQPIHRIVNVASGHNGISTYSPALQSLFQSVESVSDIDELASSYFSAVGLGPEAVSDGGWGTGPRSYKVSKAFINLLTTVLARENPEMLVNSCCPGWCGTDMGGLAGGNMALVKTAEEGARISVRLAIGDVGPTGNEDGGLGSERPKAGEKRVSGLFFENGSIIGKGWGQAKDWLGG